MRSSKDQLPTKGNHEKLELSIDWQKPRMRLWSKIISLVVTLTFLFPYLTWAFTPATFPQPVHEILFNRQRVQIPHSLGTVVEAHPGGGQLVVYVQDLHCNYEVQNNISRLIDTLADKHGLNLVTVEGMDRPVDVSRLSTIPLEAAKRNVAEYLMKEGKLSGPEHYAALGQHPISLEGIETAQLYKANVSAVQKFLNDESQGYVYDLREALNEFKSKIYNPALEQLDRKKTAYRNGELPLVKYVAGLFAQGKKASVDWAAYPQLAGYMAQKGKAIDEAGEMDDLFAEVDRLEEMLRVRLYTTAEQKELDDLLHVLDVMEKLVNISATPEELAEYRRAPGEYRVRPILEFIVRHNAEGEGMLAEESLSLDRYLDQAAEFYRVADERSRAFAENLRKKMQAQDTDIAFMLSGGYHTPEVLSEFKQLGMSYICIKPRLTHQDIVNPYFALLRNRKAPLEKYLAQNQDIFALPSYVDQAENALHIMTLAFLSAIPLNGIDAVKEYAAGKVELLDSKKISDFLIARVKVDAGVITVVYQVAGKIRNKVKGALDNIQLGSQVCSVVPGEVQTTALREFTAEPAGMARLVTSWKAGIQDVLRGDFQKLFLNSQSTAAKFTAGFILPAVGETLYLAVPGITLVMVGLLLPVMGPAALGVQIFLLLAGLGWGVFATYSTMARHHRKVMTREGLVTPSVRQTRVILTNLLLTAIGPLAVVYLALQGTAGAGLEYGIGEALKLGFGGGLAFIGYHLAGSAVQYAKGQPAWMGNGPESAKPEAERITESIPVDYRYINQSYFKTMLAALFEKDDFVKESMANVFPEMANKPISLLIPKYHVGQAKDLFEVEVRFEGDSETRTLLFVVQEGSGRNRLAEKYTALAAADARCHRFGAETDFQDETGRFKKPYHAFSLEFIPGIPMNEVIGNLERLVGTPGFPIENGVLRNGPLQKKIGNTLKGAEESLTSLVKYGLLTESEKEEILELKRKDDAEGLKPWVDKLTAMIFELDAKAVQTYFELFKNTGYYTNDPRRNNVIFNIIDGQWSFRPIDYEDMKHKPEAIGEVIYAFDIFGDKASSGIISSSVRLWGWSYTADKSGFFEAILRVYGEEEGMQQLVQARDAWKETLSQEKRNIILAPKYQHLDTFVKNKKASRSVEQPLTAEQNKRIEMMLMFAKFKPYGGLMPWLMDLYVKIRLPGYLARHPAIGEPEAKAALFQQYRGLAWLLEALPMGAVGLVLISLLVAMGVFTPAGPAAFAVAVIQANWGAFPILHLMKGSESKVNSLNVGIAVGLMAVNILLSLTLISYPALILVGLFSHLLVNIIGLAFNYVLEKSHTDLAKRMGRQLQSPTTRVGKPPRKSTGFASGDSAQGNDANRPGNNLAEIQRTIQNAASGESVLPDILQYQRVTDWSPFENTNEFEISRMPGEESFALSRADVLTIHQLAKQLESHYRKVDAEAVDVIERYNRRFADVVRKLLIDGSFAVESKHYAVVEALNTFSYSSQEEYKELGRVLQGIYEYARQADTQASAGQFVDLAARFTAYEFLPQLAASEEKLPFQEIEEGEYWDLASGYNFAFFLKNLNKTIHYRAFDTSPFVVAFLKQSAELLGVENLTVEKKNIRKLDLSAERTRIGVVRIKNIVNYVPDFSSEILKISRRITDGGAIVFQSDLSEIKFDALLGRFKPELQTLMDQDWRLEFRLSTQEKVLDTWILSRDPKRAARTNTLRDLEAASKERFKTLRNNRADSTTLKLLPTFHGGLMPWLMDWYVQRKLARYLEDHPGTEADRAKAVLTREYRMRAGWIETVPMGALGLITVVAPAMASSMFIPIGFSLAALIVVRNAGLAFPLLHLIPGKETPVSPGNVLIAIGLAVLNITLSLHPVSLLALILAWPVSHGLTNLLVLVAEDARKTPKEMLSLAEIVGSPRNGEPLYSGHPLGKPFTDHQKTLFGEYFKLGNVRFKLGWRLKVDYQEMNPAALKAVEDKTDEKLTPHMAFVVTLPFFLANALRTDKPGNPVSKLIYGVQTAWVRLFINGSLKKYAAQTQQMPLEEDAVEPLEYGGDKVFTIDEWKATAEQNSARDFYAVRPGQPGRKIGVASAEIVKLLVALNGGEDLWAAVKEQLDQFTPAGHTPSSVELIQALQMIETGDLKSQPQLEAVVAALQSILAGLQAEQDGRDPQAALRAKSELGHIADLLVRISMKGKLTLGKIDADSAENTRDDLHPLLDDATRKKMQALLQACGKRKLADKNRLTVMEKFISGEVMTPEEKTQLQLWLQALAPAGVSRVELGQDKSRIPARLVSSVVNGAVEQAEYQADEQQWEIAIPRVATLVSPTDEVSGKTLAIPFNGKLPQLLSAEYVSQFKKDLAALNQPGIFAEYFKDTQACRSPVNALAQAYQQWRADQDAKNIDRAKRARERLVRVLLQMMAVKTETLNKDESGYIRDEQFLAGLMAINELMNASGIYKDNTLVIGTIRGAEGDQEIKMPADLKSGTLWRYVWLWQHHPVFRLDDKLDGKLRQIRLRNFRISSAA